MQQPLKWARFPGWSSASSNRLLHRTSQTLCQCLVCFGHWLGCMSHLPPNNPTTGQNYCGRLSCMSLSSCWPLIISWSQLITFWIILDHHMSSLKASSSLRKDQLGDVSIFVTSKTSWSARIATACVSNRGMAWEFWRFLIQVSLQRLRKRCQANFWSVERS